MDSKNPNDLLVEEEDFLAQQNTDCEVCSTEEWLDCVGEEEGALICNTIRNNAYEDCRCWSSLDLR